MEGGPTFQSRPRDMHGLHAGVGPWWLGPLWFPTSPAPWDVAAQLRELLRYSVAGAVEGVLLLTGGFLLVTFQFPFRGLMAVFLALATPLWFVNVFAALPRRNRPVLVEFRSKYPGLFAWFRAAIAWEDLHAVRVMLSLNLLLFAAMLSSFLLLPTADPFRLWALGTGVAAVVFAVADGVVLTLGINSAGLRAVRRPHPVTSDAG